MVLGPLPVQDERAGHGQHRLGASGQHGVAEGSGRGHIQSVIVGAVLVIAAIQLAAIGVVADILAGVRTIQQRTLERVRRVELQLGVEPSHYEPGASTPYGAAEQQPPTTGAEAGPATGKPDPDRETVGL